MECLVLPRDCEYKRVLSSRDLVLKFFVLLKSVNGVI